MPPLGAVIAIITAVVNGVQKGKPFIDGLFTLLKEHDISVRDENIVRMILEAEAAKAALQAEIDALRQAGS